MAELRQLRYFVEVARCGTFTAAARNLHMTQSAVSEQVLHLESEYGCRLLLRGGRNVRVTPAGELLLSYAEPLLEKFAEAESRLSSFRTREVSCLRLGTVSGPLIGWLPGLLTEFRRVHPRIALSIGTYQTERMCAMIAGDELDFGIGHVDLQGFDAASEAGDRRSGRTAVETTRLADEDLVLVVGSDHPLAAADEVPLAAIAHETFALFPKGYVLRDIVVRACRQARFAPRVGLETDLLEVIGRFVAAGLGISFVSRTAARYRMPAGIRRVEVAVRERPRRVLVAIHPAEAPLPQPVAALLDIVRRQARDFYETPAVAGGTAAEP